MCPLSGAVMGIDPPRSQSPRRSNADSEGWDEDDDDCGPYHAHDADEEALSRLCDDTTVGKSCDGCGVPRCPFHDRGQGATCLPAACEA
jgi:hypothetical protein